MDTTDGNGEATSSTFTANATAGSYSVSASAATATTSASFSLTNIAECQPGTYSGTGGVPCTAAPAGYFVPDAGATTPTPCVLGSFNPDTGQANCTEAPAGTYVDATAAVADTPCPAGTYNPDTGSTNSAACQEAPAGTFAPAASTSPTNCPAGTYNPDTGSTNSAACLPAPAGTSVPSPGSAGYTVCSAGTYSPTTGATGCLAAPINTYVATTGATAATPCPSGTFNPTTGADNVDACLSLAQGPPMSATVPVGTAYAGQLTVSNEPSGGGAPTWTTTKTSLRVTVSSSGAVSDASTTPVGNFPLKGTETDGFGDAGPWSFTLHVVPAQKSVSIEPFAPASDVLTAALDQQITRLASIMKADSAGAVTLTGYTETPNYGVSAKVFSLDRAKAVAAYLQQALTAIHTTATITTVGVGTIGSTPMDREVVASFQSVKP